MSREPYERRHYSDADDPKRVEKYLDVDSVPDDIIRELVNAHVVQATCVHCGHEDLYSVDPQGPGDYDCLGPGCDEKLYLGDM